jgi:LCP family protein required for cell wall assembly
MVQDLYDGNIQAIIYNTAYESSLTETFPTFSSDVRELKHIEIKTKVETVAGDKTDVTKNSFTVFISGIDTEGSIATTSRSDVNMLVTVNPTTKQILMTSIPRDYYVQLPGVSGESYDKLTHAGLYGAQCSMDTLSQLFGVDVDYYAKVNFTTLRDMVNALGGVDLDSIYEFTTISGESFVQGMNYDVDGSSALAFARERYNLPNGDNDRVINQQIVLKAIINKCMSPAILTGYMGIMESLSDSFETSLSQQQISSLVRMQLNDGASWDILSSRVVGTGDEGTCYSSGDSQLYIMIPDDNSVTTAADYINRVKAGETVTQEEITAGLAN